MWQLGGFARRSPTLDRRPDRSPGAAAQGPEMSPEMPVARFCALREPRPPRASLCPERAEVRHADAFPGMPLALFRPHCPNDATASSHLNGRHPRPVNGYPFVPSADSPSPLVAKLLVGNDGARERGGCPCPPVLRVLG